MEHQGDKLKAFIKGRPEGVGGIADLLGMTRQNLGYHLRKEVLDEDFVRLVREKISGVENVFSKKESRVPVYDIDASAGNGLDFSNHLPEKIKGYISLPNFARCIAFIMVRGDSMYPKFKAGDLIGLEPVTDLDIIQWGHAYIIITHDNQRMLKFVRKGKDENSLILKSENELYDDIILPKKKIIKLFMAKGPVRDDWQ